MQLDKDEIVTKTVITIYWPKFYDRQHQHSSQGFAAPVSPMTVATIFVDNMISIASQTSGEEAWILARRAEYYERVRLL